MAEEIGDLVVKISADTSELVNLGASIYVFKEVSAAIEETGGAINDLAVEGANAATIQTQFNRIVGDEGVNVLQRLQKATMDTIDDTDLMAITTSSVIRGFNIEYLPTLGRFSLQLQQAGIAGSDLTSVLQAVETAAQTGMTRGLKPYIGDMAELKDKLKDAGSEGQKIDLIMQAIADSSAKMADPTNNAAIATEQLAAQWKKFKEEVGADIAPVMTKILEGLNSGLQEAEAHVRFIENTFKEGYTAALNDYRNDLQNIHAAKDNIIQQDQTDLALQNAKNDAIEQENIKLTKQQILVQQILEAGSQSKYIHTLDMEHQGFTQVPLAGGGYTYQPSKSTTININNVNGLNAQAVATAIQNSVLNKITS